MKRILALGLAIAALSLVPQTSVQAQGYTNGYSIGAGFFAAGRGAYYGSQQDQSPFFARHPPVYYSHVIKRPYGVSPYPVPAGIMPVEMTIVPQEPITILNPYFDNSAEPEVAPEEPESDSKSTIEEKTTWISNPFVSRVAKQ